MFLKPEGYYLDENSEAIISLVNGTWNLSENSIDRNRMIDVSIVSNGTRNRIDTTNWTDKENTTLLHIETGSAGTYVAGVSTYSRNFKMEAKAFNDYLEHDGVLDILDWRKENSALEEDANERYSKHVKSIFQVGEKRSDDYKKSLGYPIEFIPLTNPYDASTGDKLSFKLLRDNVPLTNQLVYHGTAHSHEHNHSHKKGDDHHHHDAIKLKTNAQGIVTMKVSEEGVQYLRTIHMEFSKEEGLTHESNWATITFEVGHGHSHDSKRLYYVLGAIVLLSGILYMYQKSTS